MAAPLRANDEETIRLIERTGELRLLLGEVNALANDKLSDNLMAASDVVAQTRTALVEAQGDITQIDQKLSVLRDSADAVRAASQTSVEALDTGLSAATDRVAALTAQLEESRTRLQAIESEAGDVGFNASSTLLDAISRARDAAVQAAEHIRTMLSGVVDEAHAALKIGRAHV